GYGIISSLVATVFEIKTEHGTLVVQVEDPSVKFNVDGEELVFIGTGAQEFRFRPGPHKVVATKAGVRVFDKIVTIKRDGKELVTVSQSGHDAIGRPGAELQHKIGSSTASTDDGSLTLSSGPGQADGRNEVRELRRRLKNLEDLLSVK